MQILKGYEGVQEGVARGEEYEHSEMMLYMAMVLEEGGRYVTLPLQQNLCDWTVERSLNGCMHLLPCQIPHTSYGNGSNEGNRSFALSIEALLD